MPLSKYDRVRILVKIMEVFGSPAFSARSTLSAFRRILRMDLAVLHEVVPPVAHLVAVGALER